MAIDEGLNIGRKSSVERSRRVLWKRGRYLRELAPCRFRRPDHGDGFLIAFDHDLRAALNAIQRRRKIPRKFSFRDVKDCHTSIILFSIADVHALAVAQALDLLEQLARATFSGG
jgi:hypothetical protein